MTATNPTIRFLSPDEFRPVLQAMVGMPVSKACLGKPFHEVLFGHAHQAAGERGSKKCYYDFTLSIDTRWRIVEQKRTVSRSDRSFTFAIGPFKRGPSFASLQAAIVAEVVLTPTLAIAVGFVDGQQLMAEGMLIGHNGQEYPNWSLATLAAWYFPAVDGRIKLLPRSDVRLH